MLNHPVRIDSQSGHAFGFLFQVGPDVHAGSVEPDEPWLVLFIIALDEIDRPLEHFFVDRFHPLASKWASVLYSLAPIRQRLAADYTARTKLFLEGGILRVIRVLRLLFSIQVIEISKELIEAVYGWQMLIEIAEMVLPELASSVSVGFQEFCQGGVLRLEA